MPPATRRLAPLLQRLAGLLPAGPPPSLAILPPRDPAARSGWVLVSAASAADPRLALLPVAAADRFAARRPAAFRDAVLAALDGASIAGLVFDDLAGPAARAVARAAGERTVPRLLVGPPGTVVPPLLADGLVTRTDPDALADSAGRCGPPRPPGERVLAGATIDVMAIPSTRSVWRNQQRLLPVLLGAGRRVDSAARPHTLAGLADVDVFFQWGVRPNPRKLRQAEAARRLGRPVVILEDGFVRSLDIGLSGEAALSVILDDRTAYYDATAPSRLEERLQHGPDLDEDQRARARRLIDRIAGAGVSKYNHAPPGLPQELARLRGNGRRRVLLVDQRAGDESIVRGLAGPGSFRAMVDEALALGADWDILAKVHPDATRGGRTGSLSGDLLDRLRRRPGTVVVTAEVNPYALLGLADAVSVVTSGMGFEALMAGLPVTCFGAPYYAGWGVTADRVAVPRRTRRRGVEDIFHAAWIEFSRYCDPDRGERVELEHLVEWIVRRRGWPDPPT